MHSSSEVPITGAHRLSRGRLRMRVRRAGLSRTVAVLGALTVSVGALGCGATSASTTGTQPGAPKATESISAYASRLQRAAMSGHCAQLQTLGTFFTLRDCPVQIAQMRNMKVLRSASYGTAGLIDATDAQFPKGLTWATAIGKDKKWTITEGGGLGHRSIGTSATDLKGFASAVSGTVGALRSKNCAAFVKYSVTATNGPHECDAPFASAIARALANDPAAEPKSLGGTADYQFYSVSLRGASSPRAVTYLTFTVGTTTPGPGVTYPHVTLVPTIGR